MKKPELVVIRKKSFFLVFRRWRKPDTWDDVNIAFRRQTPWCTHTHCTLFCLLKEHYERCVLVLDYRRLTPALLEEWIQTMESHCGAAHDFLFFTDGKPWRTCRPGKGKAANDVMSQVGDSDTNLVQKNVAMAIMDSMSLKLALCCKLME